MRADVVLSSAVLLQFTMLVMVVEMSMLEAFIKFFLHIKNSICQPPRIVLLFA